MFECDQRGQVFGVVRGAVHDNSVFNVGESIVDAREFFGTNLGPVEDTVLSEDIGNDLFGALLTGESVWRERQSEAEDEKYG